MKLLVIWYMDLFPPALRSSGKLGVYWVLYWGNLGDIRCSCFAVHYAYQLPGFDHQRKTSDTEIWTQFKGYGIWIITMYFSVRPMVWTGEGYLQTPSRVPAVWAKLDPEHIARCWGHKCNTKCISAKQPPIKTYLSPAHPENTCLEVA